MKSTHIDYEYTDLEKDGLPEGVKARFLKCTIDGSKQELLEFMGRKPNPKIFEIVEFCSVLWKGSD